MEERFNFPKNEEEILRFWEKNKIFEKSLKQREKSPTFVFYEGPPTANGRPGIHHVLSRSFKDAVCRYKTMRGFYVRRRAGWDTHGLPVELEIEKELGFKSKSDIEKFGITEFNRKCKASVWKYKDEWEKITKRIAFWLDLKHPYITYENYYIETLWWIIKKIYEKKLLYQDYKVVPYCPRCGTSLSSHELALGYKKVREESVYVLFKVKNQKNTYFIVWTTTPWTLPANVALAVNPDFIYNQQIIADKTYIYYPSDNFVKFIGGFINSEKKENIENLGKIKKIRGEELVGLEYEPLYKFIKPNKKAHYVVAANFVSKEEGTGIVHIAPAFGEDDMNVAKKYDLPVLMTVDEKGNFIKQIKPWTGKFVKNADPLIIKDLEKRKVLFSRQSIEHDYPFCWRCSTPLLYWAKTSWFIKISALKDKLISNNQKINWIPFYIKEGRFGEWLKDVRDWAFSRERYWGTPLPVWQCQKCKNQKFIGSIDELENNSLKSGNRYFIMRHGKANSNHDGFVSSWPEKIKVFLTDEGKKQVEKSVSNLVKKIKKIDLIFSSDLLRTKETARIAAKILFASDKKKIIFDKRLREIDVGVFNGKKIEEYEKFFKSFVEKFHKAPEKGETLKDVQKRMFNFLSEIDKKYQNKNILIISHGDPLRVLEWFTKYSSNTISQELKEQKIEKVKELKTAKIREIKFQNLPYDENGDLDLHRPYIDKIEFICDKCKGKMQRVKDLIDVWFDSGAMPFAQVHWPFEKSQISKTKGQTLKIKPPKEYPADFIAEGVDQTRGWFYTLLAVSTLLEFGPSYKNVISLGLVLDKNGQKMSKSKGNVVDPWEIIEKYGSDTLRWYFYAVNGAGDSKLFNVADLLERQRKFLLILLNSYIYFETYGTKPDLKLLKNKLAVLDKWILARLNETILLVSKSMDAFDLTTSTRTIENLLDDLSRWYIRRSRDRFSSDEKIIVSTILYFVLINISKIIAPFVPFFADFIYQKLKKFEKKAAQSVHLCDFPIVSEKLIKKEILEKMKIIRKAAYLGLKLRAMAKIKVRQPLLEFYFYIPKVQFEKDYLNLLAEELNVKKVIFNKPSKTILNEKEGELETGLNTEITTDLKNEGMIREVIRNIQELRKEAKLTPKDKIFIDYFSENQDFINLLKQNESFIKKEVLAKQISFKAISKSYLIKRELKINGITLDLAINKS